MVRGGRGYSRGSSYRGSSRGYGRREDHYSGFDSGYDKGRFSDRYRDDYSKGYRESYRHSPERKRPRNEGPPRHEYGRYESSYPPERRGYSDERERHMSPYGSRGRRDEEFRRPLPSPSRGGGGRGRISSRGSRGIRRDRGGPLKRRLVDRSYTIKRRGGIRREFSRRGKIMRGRRGGIRRRRAVDSEKEESSGEEEKEEIKVKEEKAEGEDVEMKEGDDAKVKEDKEGEGGEAKPKEKKVEEKTEKKNVFIKLACPQCNIKIPTFRSYEMHLEGRNHQFQMRKVAIKQRSILAQMRQAQRKAQNEFESSGEAVTDHTVFCPLCKLNYKQERAAHQATAAHKNMRKFLMPTCKVCKITFKSPMIYEHHLCSIEHLKRKQKSAAVSDEDNLEEFTTIDSVGEVGDEKDEEKEKERTEKKKKLCVGIELVKKIEAYYCDLCRMFLPRGTENEYPDIIAGHCRKHFHMQRYIRQKENEELKKKAEKLQQKETAEKEKDKPKAEGEEAADENKDVEMKEEGDTSKNADDDKLWDAVDKDLGELLEETDGRDDEDDEERVNGGRYDRFKSAEKEGEGDAADTQEDVKTEEQ